jgi:glutathione S-transferase
MGDPMAKMKLYYSPTSPYARKVRAAAIETGLDKKIDLVPATVSPVAASEDVDRVNPVGKVPALVDGKTALFDSVLICEYLDSKHRKTKLFPKSGAAKWTALRQHAMADGLLDAALLARYETFLRPQQLRWSEWVDGQLKKVKGAVAAMEKEAPKLGNRANIGTIGIACALGYLDFRFPDLGWRTKAPKLAAWHAKFSQRPSIKTTVPPT